MLKNIFDAMKREGYVIKDLDLFLVQQSNRSNDRAINVNAPSQVGGCPRSIFYARTGVKSDPCSTSPREQRIFDNGSFMHIRLQEYLMGQGMLLMDEVPVIHPDLQIQGHTDGILALSSKELGILELKSINDKGFKDVVNANSPKDHHILQGLTYAYCIETRRQWLQKCYDNNIKKLRRDKLKLFKQYATYYQHLKGGRKFTKEEKIHFQCTLHWKLDELLVQTEMPITKVIYLYENKNDQELKEYCIDTQSSDNILRLNSLIADWKQINENVRTGKVPNRMGLNKSDSTCRWCRYKLECWI